MKQIERYNLIGKIALTLQERMNTTGINVFLGGFGIEHEQVSIVPSKRVYVENLLASAGDALVVQIAQDLDVPIPSTTLNSTRELAGYLSQAGYQAATHDFERALAYVETDAEQALGSASSTLESICKGVLDEFGVTYPRDESLQPLLKAVFEQLQLSPDGHADPDIKRVLGGLVNTSVGIGVLRTRYSGFHGKGGDQKRRRLTDRHARLAVNACATVGVLIVETYRERFSG
ncbi:abortive infection family protein [Halospina sp. K52047b]|uniref:abortive infection family protein n=1 Tax=Halospina sp. K52047b TaxID=2614160 RepID=UPI00124A45E6|nr:abortive infection family protein [Halospina sp. K52047b]KAA8985526.1 abortive infection family protein [Halospina sp. K52047b]